MERSEFKERMKQYKKAREENPGLKYWEWKSIPKYDEGGEVGDNKAIPTQEEYIAEQIAAKRAAALNKSRNRTSIRVPMVANNETEEQWRNRIDDGIRFQEEGLSRIMADYDFYKNNYGISFIQKQQATLDKLLEEKDKGYLKLVPGANCMYNAGDCYGLNIPSNQTFVAKHKELGFKKAPKGNMAPGDIVQDVKSGTPSHAMIYDSKDAEGNLLFNYARGETGYNVSDINKNYVKKGKYPLPIKDYDVYKYVGTPADSAQWINDYKKIYGFADGGEVDQRQLILNRANAVSTNYSDAKDFTLDPVNYAIRKLAKTLFGRGGISNCTLSATRWVDPNNQYMSAKNIFNNPDSGYTEISKDYVLPGDLLITKVPNKDSYHTMLVEGFNGDEPILRYSKGGHDTENNLVTGRTLSLYHKLDKEQGGNHDEDHYFRYNLPNEYWLPEITVTPKK